MFDVKKKRLVCAAAAAAAAWTAPVAWAQTAAAGEVRQVLPSMQVVRDPVTGRLRAPTHEEVAAAATPAAAAQRGAASSSTAPSSSLLAADHPLAQLAAKPAPAARFGAVAKRVELSKLSYSVAGRSADGSLDTHCVAGESAAEHALHNAVKGTQGARHDR
jgi:hypothetical protein